MPLSSTGRFELSNFLHYSPFATSLSNMKSALLWVTASFAAQKVAGHATFQELWVNGVDEICVP